MNPRIKELELEAAYGIIDPNEPFTAEEFHNFTKKFAELIVKECIECADFVGQVNIVSGYPNSTAHHVKQKIKQHFGFKG